MKKKPIIAIIDSGIAKDVPFAKKIIGGIAFYIKANNLYCSDNIVDECGHGTKCASIIDKYASNAMLYIIKIVDKTSKCSSILLLEALKHLLFVDVSIINISLSVSNSCNTTDISAILKKLRLQEKIILASVKNRENMSFPANNNNVIGVKGKLMVNNTYNYDYTRIIEVVANATPIFTLSLRKRYEWFGGNSKATALMSAEIANYFNKEIDLDGNRVSRYLQQYSCDLFENNLNMCGIVLTKKEKSLLKILKPIFSKYANEIDSGGEFVYKKMDFNLEYTYELMLECEKKLGVKINMQELAVKDFYSFENLAHYIYMTTVSKVEGEK